MPHAELPSQKRMVKAVNIEAMLLKAASILKFDICVTLLKAGKAARIHEIGPTDDWLMSGIRRRQYHDGAVPDRYQRRTVCRHLPILLMKTASIAWTRDSAPTMS